MSRRLVWFSCGVSSAVASKIAIEKYGRDCEIVYCDTMADEHPDNFRFLSDVEKWISRKILIIRSDKFSSINDVFERTRYMSGIAGARCTTELKKLPREKFQNFNDIHIFGYTINETKRASVFEENNKSLKVEWILIEEKITKAECFERLIDAGIAFPKMYALGFKHNNCIGCVKSASSGYWNRVRKLFPETFRLRANQSRLIGARLVNIKLPGKKVSSRIFLDELPLDENSPDDDIECGPACQTPSGLSQAT